MTLQSINPTTGELFATYEEWPTEKAQDVVRKVHRDYVGWRRTGFDRRASLIMLPGSLTTTLANMQS